MSDEDSAGVERLEMTAGLVAAYLGNNPVPADELAGLIGSVHAALSGLGRAPVPAAPARRAPPVPIRKSVTPDYLVSLEDGRQYKSLKRHLAGRGLTPVAYRVKWGLDPEYPMVAPNYAKRRSDLAKASGLGRRPAPVAPAKPARARRTKG